MTERKYQVGVDGFMVGHFHESFVDALDWARERFERFTIARWGFGTIYREKGDHGEETVVGCPCGFHSNVPSLIESVGGRISTTIYQPPKVVDVKSEKKSQPLKRKP